MRALLLKIVILLLCLPSFLWASKFKDITTIKGMRENQLIGYGLVIGLKGTGDSKVEYTSKSVNMMFKQLGLDLERESDSKNVAAVIVTATLPAFAKVGGKIDVMVSSIGNAKSLMGGTLLFTPIKGPDQKVYATVQGPVIVGGYSVGGGDSGGDSATKNHPTVGKLANGAIVENEIPNTFHDRTSVRLTLNDPDFTTAARAERIINNELGGVYAKAKDAATLDVFVPYSFRGHVVDLISIIENLDVDVQVKSRIVMNEKTGTVVMGSDVKIRQVAIAHGNLSITVKSEPLIEEKASVVGADGEQKQVEAPPIVPAIPKELPNKKGGKAGLKVAENKEKLMLLQGTSIGEVVSALNQMGISPRDLITIIQSLKTAGAIDAEIILL